MEFITPAVHARPDTAFLLRIVLDTTDDASSVYGYAVRHRGATSWEDPTELVFTDGAADVNLEQEEADAYELTVDTIDFDSKGVPAWANGDYEDHPVAYEYRIGGPEVPRVEVQLVGPGSGPGATVGTGEHVASYDGFVQFLQTSFVGDARQLRLLGVETADATGKLLPGPTPVFGAGPDAYDDLLDAARDYAQLCTANTIGDLFPAGYLDERRRAEPNLAAFDGEIGAGLPCIELIWSYWQEEAGLVQTLNHILARFQNRRVAAGDPLARFDVSPLLPLRSLLWAWVENEHRRLTVRRRAAEYEFEYGLPLIGRVVPRRGTYVERRSGFLSSFHTILHLATKFFKELDDLTITADGFPLYEALRQCHLVLSQGSQNQYGEMAVSARAEMLVMQHILAQPPMREFLGGRPMTPYPEPWMDRVDSMKAIQGWSPTSVMHFHDLATFGERLVLTIRLGNWAAPNVSGPDAAVWATGFRGLIQRYIAAYRAVTGVDLAAGPDDTVPSQLISQRIADARTRA